MEKINTYIDANKDRFLSELFDLLRIPSISAKKEHNADMLRAAKYVQSKLLEAGAGKVEIIKTEGHPVLIGEKIIDPTLPTVLVYGHYDVQPVEPLNLWQSKPFEPEIRDGKIYARGADDDKGQFFMHVKAFECMVKSGNLPCNVKFIVEGEEEIGSVHLKAFCEKYKERLKCDIILR